MLSPSFSRNSLAIYPLLLFQWRTVVIYQLFGPYVWLLVYHYVAPLPMGLGYVGPLMLVLGTPYCMLDLSGLLGLEKGSYSCVGGIIP
jgi:hypothetical protein